MQNTSSKFNNQNHLSFHQKGNLQPSQKINREDKDRKRQQVKILSDLENLLTPLKDEEYSGLLDSIRENGQFDQIKLGMIESEGEPFIIDGHNRYRICRKLGLDPTYSENVLDF